MITRENLRDLAGFQSPEGCAVSFYYQPQTPQNKSHREEAILVKDLVREALRKAETTARDGSTRADLERILSVAEQLRGNHARGKAIFACAAKNFWQEFDLPPRLPATRLFVNQRFHLKPLLALMDSLWRACALLVDRTRARWFDVSLEEVAEREKLSNELPRRGRSDGWGGYDAGHAERHVDHEAMHFFKRCADRLQELYESGYERFIIGCRDETWPELEPYLHPYVRQRVVGRFAADPATVTADEVRKHTERLLKQDQLSRRQRLLREAVGQAGRDSRGALGLKRVLEALETGEIQTLLISQEFAAPGVRCPSCGHLDARITPECAACGRPAEELEDVSDILLWEAVRRGIEVMYFGEAPELTRYDGIAALLRFRADQNTEVRKAG